ncbi:MAG TPA: hypothetical protein VHL11_16075 [Phototrophicaceae bacterium]|jgi:indole-3-glycerol phosphate synthase|nr:hypothetical protein [Phototrophicaceae bacterium]
MTVSRFGIDTENIVNTKRDRLYERKLKTPNAAVIALADMQQRPRPILNIVTGGETIAIIGRIMHEEIYDPVGMALRYARAGVDAISFFTDGQIYGNGLEDMLLVTRAVQRPILSQDFILDEYHVAEARAAGASALTLYSSVLDPVALRRTVSLTQRWRMTAIVQIETKEQIEHIHELSPHVVAIGTLDERDTESDMELLRILRPLIPYNIHCMLLDPLATIENVKKAIDLGVDAIIVDDRLLGHAESASQLFECVRSHVKSS